MRIGILEDNQALGNMLKLSLGLAGHTVHTSHTVNGFLTFVTSPTPPNLIIVDYHLIGDFSGTDVIRHIRTIQPNLPAILISAAPLTKLEAAAAGISKVKILQKPFKMLALQETITTIT
ncbi:MAG TPA: response regulator [Ktedonosporobacter sp.]|nr:response regulator [Ktedonosporobacter sp.]